MLEGLAKNLQGPGSTCVPPFAHCDPLQHAEGQKGPRLQREAWHSTTTAAVIIEDSTAAVVAVPALLGGVGHVSGQRNSSRGLGPTHSTQKPRPSPSVLTTYSVQEFSAAAMVAAQHPSSYI